MENNQTEQINEDDEISLIDLGAVLIRYRKPICIFTLGATLLTALWLFAVAPRINSDTAEPDISLTYTLRVTDMSPVVAAAINGSSSEAKTTLAQTAISIVSEPYIAAAIHTKAPVLLTVKEIAKMQKSEYNKFIAEHITADIKNGRSLKQSEYGISFKEGTFNTIFVKMSIPASRRDAADAFVNETVRKINTVLGYALAPRLDQKLSDTTEAIARLSEGKSSDSGSQALSDLIVLSQELKNFKVLTIGGYANYSPDDTFEVTGNGRGRAKKTLIVFLASLFLSVFFAFAANAVHSIKEDPEASKKLKDAWEQGK